MKFRVTALICLICLLTGCKSQNVLDQAVRMRTEILSATGYTFQCEVTADYGDKLYTFLMDCRGDQGGNLTFTVTEPATIAGICGKISSDEGALTFDDRVLAFETIADDYLTPVTAPWIFLKGLRSGYISSCAETDNGYCIEVDDTYKASSFRLNIGVDSDWTPNGVEIYWNNRRIITMKVDNFMIL